MKLVHQYIAIFFPSSPTSNHLHPLQVENCDSNSRLVVDEDDNAKFRLKRVKVAQRSPDITTVVSLIVQWIYNMTSLSLIQCLWYSRFQDPQADNIVYRIITGVTATEVKRLVWSHTYFTDSDNPAPSCIEHGTTFQQAYSFTKFRYNVPRQTPIPRLRETMSQYWKGMNMIFLWKSCNT